MKLFTRLWEEHQHKSETWNFIADCEFQVNSLPFNEFEFLNDLLTYN